MTSITELPLTASPAVGRLLTTATATVAAVVAELAATAAGADLVAGDRRIGPGAVVLVSLLAGLAASGLAAVLARAVARPRRWFAAAAGTVLLVSLTGPLGATSGGGVLLLLHLIVGGVLIAGIGGTLVRRTSHGRAAE